MTSSFIRIATLAAFWLVFYTAAFAQVSQVADLNTGISRPESSSPNEYTVVSPSKAYFRACDEEFGCEVWKTDGSTAGTVRITDICPGACNNSAVSPGNFTLIGTKMYLSASDGQRGNEPWVIDVATDTASIVVDLLPGSGSSSPQQFKNAINIDGTVFLYFSQIAPGSPARRTRIARLSAAGALTFTDTAFDWNGSIDWVAYNGALYGVAAPTGTQNFELSKLTLGAASVTVSQVKDIEPGVEGARISELKVSLAPQKILFFASTLAAGRELYSSDGTSAGTAIIAEQNIGAASSSCSDEITPVLIQNSVVGFFSSKTSGSNCELFRTDGTAAGTTLVKDIFPGVTGSKPMEIRAFGAGVVFVAEDSDAVGREFWRSDGTSAGTTLIRDLVPSGGGVTPFNFAQSALVTSGFYYFRAFNGDLFRTDGTSAGTRVVGTNLSTVEDSNTPLSAVNGVVLYRARSFNQGGFGEEPARAPIANPNTTELLKNIAGDVGNSSPSGFADFQARAVFTTFDTFATYITQPTAAPLQLAVGNFSPAVASGNRFYLRTFSDIAVSDGTVPGTFELSPDFNQIGAVIATPFGTYFLAKTRDVNGDGDLDFSDAYDLWRTDGTEAGTVKITSRQTLPDTLVLSDRNDELIINGNDVLIAGFDIASFSNNGLELYRIDTTTGTAALVRDIAPGATSSDPNGFTRIGSTIYFRASGNSNNRELWKTDGTAQGTLQVADINPSGSSNPESFVVLANTLYFTATSPDGTRDIYQTTGTGVALAADFGATINTVESGARLVVSGDRVYFPSINQTENGARIYYTTGAAASVQQLGGIPSTQPGPAPEHIIAGPTARSVVFSGWDAANGRELWYSDGTNAGTRQVSQIAPGARHSNPDKLTRVGNRIYFAANDTVTGIEPWVLDVDQLDRVFSNGFE